MSKDKSTETSGKTLLKSSFGMSFATLLSRITGLVRVRLESTVFGGGDVASAWFFAFAIANLFRRVLGEGAIANALIPLIADTDAREGREKAKKQLAFVFLLLGAILAVIVLTGSLVSWLILKYSPDWEIGFLNYPRIRMMFQLLIILMPYGFFICLTGVVGAVLNYAGSFMFPAMVSLLLNIVLLAGLSIAWVCAMSPGEFLPMLAWLVPISGALQLILVTLWMWKLGFFPNFRCFVQGKDICRKLWKLAFPGIVSYSVLQLSFVIDQSMAASLNSQAIPALNYVYRIVDIPIGLVAVSFGTVLVATMSRAAAAGDIREISRSLEFSLRVVWFVTLPLAALIIFFHNNMLHVLCLGGRYTNSDLQAAHWVAVFYSLGIPFFCSLKVLLPAFYSRKKMTTTLVVSSVATVLNIGLNYILMRRFAQGGIALATVFSSIFQNAVLLWLLSREKMIANAVKTALTFVRSATVSLGVAGGLYWIYLRYFEAWSSSHWSCELIFLAALGTVFSIGYFGISYLLRSPECSDVIAILMRKIRKKA
ncbi:MAG: murein biosynthesis integral membrane protein MurJ [Lentisphaerae bacterium]|nr:murein biosynthesis integral membrane protein MurJ [Lentisphaerota bacterium]